MKFLPKVRKELRILACPTYAKVAYGFFKTTKGEYGYGDKFFGIKVPQLRVIAKKYVGDLTLDEVAVLLCSRMHEERMLALLLLVLQYQKGDAVIRKTIYAFYLEHITCVNNWDLVDISAPAIVGEFLLTKDKNILHKLVRAKNLWQRRIAIVATLYFIRQGVYIPTLVLAKQLLHDKEDLLHKAVGWMLREVGKRKVNLLKNFLRQHSKTMPRVMLRYAKERMEK